MSYTILRCFRVEKNLTKFSLKGNGRWLTLLVFLLKSTSRACLLGSGLKFIFHWKVQSLIHLFYSNYCLNCLLLLLLKSAVVPFTIGCWLASYENSFCMIRSYNYLYNFVSVFSFAIYRNTIKMHKTMETELSHYTTFRNYVPRHKDVHWLLYRCYMDEHNACSFTSEPSQSSNRRVSSFNP